jgi:hypothetical protein
VVAAYVARTGAPGRVLVGGDARGAP